VSPALQASLEKAWTVVTAAVWAAVGGGVGVVADALDDLNTYQGPLDWAHLRKVFIAGAIMGFIGWIRKEKALATPVPPTPQSDAAAVKRVAEAAAPTVPVVMVVPTETSAEK